MLKTACGNGFPLNIPSVIPESGGSGGTSDYSELSNKPKINNVTLSGDKSAADLGLASADIEDLIPADASSSNQLATAADLPGLATTSAAGLVQPDGTTITIDDGVISAVGGGGGNAYGAFSTNETEIGTWLGSPLYRKVYNLGNMPNNTIVSYPTPIPAGATVVKMDVIVTSPTSGVRKLNYYSADMGAYLYYNFNPSLDGGNTQINAKDNWSAATGIAIFEYTKAS